MRNVLKIVVVTLSLLAFPAQALSPQAQDIIADLRCISCGGQPLNESHAPLAKDIRAYVETSLEQGKTATEIKANLTATYGPEILQTAPGAQQAPLLWALPLFLTILIIYGVWKRRRA